MDFLQGPNRTVYGSGISQGCAKMALFRVDIKCPPLGKTACDSGSELVDLYGANGRTGSRGGGVEGQAGLCCNPSRPATGSATRQRAHTARPTGASTGRRRERAPAARALAPPRAAQVSRALSGNGAKEKQGRPAASQRGPRPAWGPGGGERDRGRPRAMSRRAAGRRPCRRLLPRWPPEAAAFAVRST